ncbi:MFS transporter [Catenuloplanes atrovinosus]|uniref:MFS family permease n=1 Tax=Catenuloplanes atrovinosus TaxID=137266 RepID=A0AAE4C7Q2_9ACTN|nr:MFS transporter [Catenuloplanes atrovinosus]MDR7274123.1 MFS family permease [Catenuloplanes atrovinosus]
MSITGPLRIAVYRNLWLAVLVSNVGLWMQTVGAQWLLVAEPNASTLVSLVQTASLAPVFLLALPAGALADSLGRRRLLLAVQAGLALVAGLLTLLTALGDVHPALLLTFTFALGAGQALTLPAWQATIPDLVPRDQLVSASALGSISINAARAVGPAVAGLLIAQAGAAVVFGINALTFVLFAAVLAAWRPDRTSAPRTPEPFTSAVRAGTRYVRHSPVVRRILLRAVLFIAPGNALWALLPLVASQRLGFGSGGYGLMLTVLGAGAVAGAFLLAPIRDRISNNQMLLAAGIGYAAVLAVLGLVRVPALVMIALLPAGIAWVAVLSTINASMQLFLPGWVRARGLAIYQIVISAAQALPALAWGLLADATGLPVALTAAAALMLAGALTLRFWALIDTRTMDRAPAVFWPEPHLTLEPDPRTGPILVTVRYKVSAANAPAFVTAMDAVRRAVQRTGAYRWGLFRDGAGSGTFVEVYLVSSWEEHLRQHTGRLTGADRAAEEHARSLADGPPEVSHLFPATAAPTA